MKPGFGNFSDAVLNFAGVTNEAAEHRIGMDVTGLDYAECKLREVRSYAWV